MHPMFTVLKLLLRMLQSYKNPRTLIITGPGDDTRSNNYQDLASKHSSPTVLPGGSNPSKTFEDHVLEQFNKDTAGTRHNLIAGASFDKNKTTAWFNDQPYHAVPLSLNLVQNSRLKSAGVSLKIVNKPLPYTTESKAELSKQSGVSIWEILSYVFGIVGAYFIIFPLKERAVKSKHLQFVSGANVFVFWGVHLLFDFLCFLPPCVLVIIILGATQEENFQTFPELGRLFALLICFVWAILPFIYLMSFFFVLTTSGYIFVMMFIIITGSIFFIMVMIFRIFDKDDVANILQWIFFFLPPYCLVDGVYSLNTYSTFQRHCDKFKPKCTDEEANNFCCPGKCPPQGCVSNDYFQWAAPGIGRHIFFLLCLGCIFIIILLIVDSRICDRCAGECVRIRHAKKKENEQEEEDSDVREEKDKIHSLNDVVLAYNYSLALRDVTKYYRSFLAVDSVCVGVKAKECFGLLGVNGAGKTTTFKMMTGDIRMSKGDGFIEGFNLKNDIKKIHKVIGYCPQFDALIEIMTGRETIRMYCLLRGFSDDEIPEITQQLGEELIFLEHIDKMIKQMSGGTKRKISVAIALLSKPSVVFLDEPTSGMDPTAKRQVWNTLIKVREKGTSVILTSHSMEECEALCTRLVIMVNGKFICIGSVQYLKSKFAEGYTLIIKAQITSKPREFVGKTSVSTRSSVIPDTSPLKKFVADKFPGALLKDEYMATLTYYIPRTKLKWYQMFGLMEKAKKKLNIEDYSIGQTSLEQIFITLTKSQKDEHQKK